MPDRFESTPPLPAEPYSPQLRTALVLTGTGTAGAYHAGVLRALHEAGIKLDIVAARGIGVVGAIFAAIDGSHRLWDEKGFWRTPTVRSLYPWHWMLRVGVCAVALSLALVALPLMAMALAAIVFPIDFVARMIGLGGAAGAVGAYVDLVESAFAAEGFPTWLPRLVVMVLGTAGAIIVVAAFLTGGPRRQRGPLWWRALRSPLSSTE